VYTGIAQMVERETFSVTKRVILQSGVRPPLSVLFLLAFNSVLGIFHVAAPRKMIAGCAHPSHVVQVSTL